MRCLPKARCKRGDAVLGGPRPGWVGFPGDECLPCLRGRVSHPFEKSQKSSASGTPREGCGCLRLQPWGRGDEVSWLRGRVSAGTNDVENCWGFFFFLDCAQDCQREMEPSRVCSLRRGVQPRRMFFGGERGSVCPFPGLEGRWCNGISCRQWNLHKLVIWGSLGELQHGIRSIFRGCRLLPPQPFVSLLQTFPENWVWFDKVVLWVVLNGLWVVITPRKGKLSGGGNSSRKSGYFLSPPGTICRCPSERGVGVIYTPRFYAYLLDERMALPYHMKHKLVLSSWVPFSSIASVLKLSHCGTPFPCSRFDRLGFIAQLHIPELAEWKFKFTIFWHTLPFLHFDSVVFFFFKWIWH